MNRRDAPKFDREPDFRGHARFRVNNKELEKTYECCFFVPVSEADMIWMLVRGAREGVIQGHGTFDCELRLTKDGLVAEDVYHSGWIGWDWGIGTEENTLVAEISKLTITHGNPENSGISTVEFSIHLAHCCDLPILSTGTRGNYR